MTAQHWVKQVCLRKQNFWLAFFAAFIFSVACYWSDWVTLLRLYEFAQDGSMVRNAAKALLAGIFLGVFFKGQVWAAILGLIAPSFLVRQIGIARETSSDSNLVPLVVGVDVFTSILIALTMIVVSIVAKRLRRNCPAREPEKNQTG
jgi:hypothetical protein